ncbi:MAG: stage II sporulation protein M [Verrucomicrobia bacterium]|nr:stage II sporulation protein M [Verrucomicrobiota bacterium]
MTPARFLESRRDAWTRIEALVRKAGRQGVAVLTDAEIHELTRLYPATAVDVARARMYGLDATTQQRINRLAITAHGLLYRRPCSRDRFGLLRFLGRDYPRLFRKRWRYVALSAAIFLITVLGAYVTVLARPSAAYEFVPQGLDVEDPTEVTPSDVGERYRRTPQALMASFITTNNIQVALLAFALGITAGIGTFYVLAANGMMLGAFVAHFQNHGYGYEVAAFLTPHGVLEIFAILVAGAAGIRFGLSLAMPGRVTRKESLKIGAQEAVRLVLGTIPMFIVAGAIESFITPSHIPGGFKIIIGLGSLSTALLYLLVAGRNREGAPIRTTPGTPQRAPS